MLSSSHSFSIFLSLIQMIGIPSYLLTNGKHHSHQRLSSLIRSSKKRVIKVYQVRYELGKEWGIAANTSGLRHKCMQ